MKYKALIREDETIILPKQILEFLNVESGDKLEFELLENGEVKVKKVQNFSSFLDDLNKQMIESGSFEKAGLKNEDDVAEFIRKLRDDKNSSN